MSVQLVFYVRPYVHTCSGGSGHDVYKNGCDKVAQLDMLLQFCQEKGNDKSIDNDMEEGNNIYQLFPINNI